MVSTWYLRNCSIDINGAGSVLSSSIAAPRFSLTSRAVCNILLYMARESASSLWQGFTRGRHGQFEFGYAGVCRVGNRMYCAFRVVGSGLFSEGV